MLFVKLWGKEVPKDNFYTLINEDSDNFGSIFVIPSV